MEGYVSYGRLGSLQGCRLLASPQCAGLLSGRLQSSSLGRFAYLTYGKVAQGAMPPAPAFGWPYLTYAEGDYQSLKAPFSGGTVLTSRMGSFLSPTQRHRNGQATAFGCPLGSFRPACYKGVHNVTVPFTSPSLLGQQ